MIKSKAKKFYYGVRVYAHGVIGKVVSHSIVEGKYGVSEDFEILTPDGNIRIYDEKVVCLEKVKFMVAMNTVTAVVKVDGRTYIGHAVANPNDNDFDMDFGKSLALARAMQDKNMEEELLETESIAEEDEEDEDEMPDGISGIIVEDEDPTEEVDENEIKDIVIEEPADGNNE